MIRCSLPQALSVWTDLELALAGENKYGGDTAEIYAYRLQEYSPSAAAIGEGSIICEAKAEAAQQASDTLYELLKHFAETREAKIRVGNMALGRWKREPEYHRWHVTVVPRKA